MDSLDGAQMVKKPFVNYTLDEDKEKDNGKIFTVRLNKKEYEELLDLKNSLNLDNDSTALKVGFSVGRNVLHNTFTKDILKWLTDGKRKRSEQ